MRVLILGGAGMLGHKLWQRLGETHETWVTLRTENNTLEVLGNFEADRTLLGVDAYQPETIARVLGDTNPDVVINCIGIIKQRPEAEQPLPSLQINALFPHQLAAMCRNAGSRLVHISTDCVFSGRKGMYSEQDVSEAEDLYGRTKYLGEVSGDGCLTLRTSLIGRELRADYGLVEWFLSNRGGRVRGYRRAVFSGLTTEAFVRLLETILLEQPELSGVFHVASVPINKYDLLCLLRDAYGIKVEIDPDSEVVVDRSLDGSRLSAETGLRVPGWPEMAEGLSADPTPYDVWRGK